MVLALDNIGQGEREPMGHREVVAPFVCGTSLQGMITMETLAWIEWAKKHEQVDSARMAAIGNSGGGHLTITLAALSTDLAAIVSSGRPSTSEFTARKERKLCHCSMVPGVIGKIECWHMLACFAPRPLYIFQGRSDPLFPFDLFNNVARKVRTVYSCLDAEQNFKAEVVPGEHSWDTHRIGLVGDFLSRVLDLPVKELEVKDETDDHIAQDAGCLDAWPEQALDTEELAQQITGIEFKQGTQYWDIFPPDPWPDIRDDDPDREEILETLARFEGFLTKHPPQRR
jgi:dienelactone hydrolase